VSNQKGFTLIEIIAVLVILGILAAVAIPRFMDLTDVASKKASMQAISEGKSRLSNEFASLLLRNSSPPSVASVAAANTDAGDFFLQFTPGTTNIAILGTARPGRGPKAGTTAVGTWRLPQ